MLHTAGSERALAPEIHILEMCSLSVLRCELESSMTGMTMLKPLAEAGIDFFQVCLSDYVLLLPITCGPLAQGSVDFVND